MPVPPQVRKQYCYCVLRRSALAATSPRLLASHSPACLRLLRAASSPSPRSAVSRPVAAPVSSDLLCHDTVLCARRLRVRLSAFRLRDGSSLHDVGLVLPRRVPSVDKASVAAASALLLIESSQ